MNFDQRAKWQAEAVRHHQSKVNAIKRSRARLADALRDYFTDQRLETWEVLADFAITALTDETEAGRQLAELAKDAAHECARYQLGDDDIEAIEPVEKFKPTQSIIEAMHSGKLMGLSFPEHDLSVDAARGIKPEAVK